MAKNFNGNSKLSSLISTPVRRTAKPSSEFYSIFSDEEVLSIIHALEVRREIPLKYSYKGTGAKTWDSFYRKYIIPQWYRISNPEIDLLRKNFDNEIGSNSEWDGTVRGGFKYHVDQVYAWIKKNIGIRGEDCELVRKYDEKTDSIVATMKIRHNYTINFCFMGLDKTMEIFEGEEITIWRQHKYEIPEILQEIERAGLQLVHYSTDKYLSNILVICKVATN